VLPLALPAPELHVVDEDRCPHGIGTHKDPESLVHHNAQRIGAFITGWEVRKRVKRAYEAAMLFGAFESDQEAMYVVPHKLLHEVGEVHAVPYVQDPSLPQSDKTVVASAVGRVTDSTVLCTASPVRERNAVTRATKPDPAAAAMVAAAVEGHHARRVIKTQIEGDAGRIQAGTRGIMTRDATNRAFAEAAARIQALCRIKEAKQEAKKADAEAATDESVMVAHSELPPTCMEDALLEVTVVAEAALPPVTATTIPRETVSPEQSGADEDPVGETTVNVVVAEEVVVVVSADATPAEPQEIPAATEPPAEQAAVAGQVRILDILPVIDAILEPTVASPDTTRLAHEAMLLLSDAESAKSLAELEARIYVHIW